MPQLIAFDLDGVLYTSEPFIADAYCEAIEEVNRLRPDAFVRVPTVREILDHVGWPVSTILARLFPEIAPEAVELLQSATLETICRRVAAREGEIYPAVPDVLRGLRAGGYLLAVASNGRQRYVQTVLATYELTNLFVVPMVADDPENQAEQKVALLRGYLTRHQVRPRDAVMVGDRASDVAAARAVGCHFIGCNYGHGYGGEIEGAGLIIRRFDEIPATVVRLLGSQLGTA
jgi:phosphoglycolate phosphatase